MNLDYDVAIIGGAFSGAATALLIKRKHPAARVVIIEKAAERAGIEIRYYNIIYDLVDDVKAAMSGLLAPTLREERLGEAQILEVFNVSKVGKIAGCRVLDGVVRQRGPPRLSTHPPRYRFCYRARVSRTTHHARWPICMQCCIIEQSYFGLFTTKGPGRSSVGRALSPGLGHG